MSIEQQVKVQRLVDRCGAGVNLALDVLLSAKLLLQNYLAPELAYTMSLEQRFGVTRLPMETLMSALQNGRPVAAATECRFCSPAQPLEVLYHNLSGSNAERFSDMTNGKVSTSDFDFMMEFGGSFHWMTEAVVGAGVEPDCISPQSAPQLWAKPTNHAGFVTLHWARTSQCSHKTPLPALSADSVRQLMEHCCRVLSYSEITTAGPAVNVRRPDCLYGGCDYVPCLRVPWWPAEDDFLYRHRKTNFPPAVARRDICQFGVHLVPTGRPGSDTEQIEWRVSFSRAEVVVAQHLSARQIATVRAVKTIKNCLKDTGEAPSIKSYYIKTAMLWLMQDQPSDCWTSVLDGVHMVLDWLELCLTGGSLPCFFWPAINLLAGLSTRELEDMTKTVWLMRRHATRVLMASCLNVWPLELLLEGSSEPLSERQLRFFLARLLVWEAVVSSIGDRPSAPWWQSWFGFYIPTLALLSEHRLLQLIHRRHSGAYKQQGYLLQALLVAPADLMAGMRLSSLGGDLFSWPVTPLLDLLTESDLQVFLGDRDALAAWCRRQLCRPPAERPAGLTAELDTPQGRAEMLLQPDLLLRAFSEADSGRLIKWQRIDQVQVKWCSGFKLPATYQQARQFVESSISCDLEAILRHRLPDMDGRTAAVTARCWRLRLHDLASGDRLRVKFTALTTRWRDRWQLRQYAMLDITTQDSPQRDKRGVVGGEQWCASPQEWQEEERCCCYTEERKELERRYRQELEEQERRHHQELEEQERRHRQELEEQERRHRQELEEQERRHRQELEEQERRHRQEPEEQERRHHQELEEQERRHRQELEEQEKQQLKERVKQERRHHSSLSH